VLFELGPEHFSPALLRKITYLGGNSRSFEEARQALAETLELDLSSRHIQTLSERVGRELAAQRDHNAQLWERRELPPGGLATAPQAVAIAVDDGKVRTRAEAQPPGVHEPGWRNDKVASLTTYALQLHADDPMPEPPIAFTQRATVERLVAELGHVRCNPKPPAPAAGATPALSAARPPRTWAPKPLVRSCVVTQTGAERFGAMVAAEAQLRRFPEAQERVFLGDGEPSNWTLQELYFPDCFPLLDFVHLIEHLYAAAKAGEARMDWPLYLRLVRAAWRGESQPLLDLLQRKADRLGPPPEHAEENDPRKIATGTLRYVTRNAQRLAYPRARRLGLPVTSAQVESLVNTVNLRVKDCGKFWCPAYADDILQIRAAAISQTDRWPAFWKNRAAAQLGRVRAPSRRAA
jgi:hypothetical protein